MSNKYQELVKTIPKKIVVEMKDWCLDCAVNEEDAENIQEASDVAIIRWVDKNYCGGVNAFLAMVNE